MKEISDELLKRAIELTKLIHVPKQSIATFWDVEIYYFVISPISENSFTLRTGVMTCRKPVLLSLDKDSSSVNIFEEKEIAFIKEIVGSLFEKLNVLGYQFTRSGENKLIVEGSFDKIIDDIKQTNAKRLNKIGVIKAPSNIWSYSLLNLFFHILSNSVQSNVSDLQERGYFRSEKEKQESEINALFLESEHDKAYIKELGNCLQKYGLFAEYEERFFSLIKRHNVSS